jgi:hypothetical protein
MMWNKMASVMAGTMRQLAFAKIDIAEKYFKSNVGHW